MYINKIRENYLKTLDNVDGSKGLGIITIKTPIQ